MFGDANSPQEVLIKNHVEFGGEAGELWTFRWANGDLVFPPEHHQHANARRQAALKSKMRGRRWIVPPFDQRLFQRFEPNPAMMSLFSNITTGTSNPAPTAATMGRNDDDSADYSFTNEDATSTFTTGRKSGKKEKTKKVSIDELASDLRSMILGGKGAGTEKMKELLNAVTDFAAGDSAALTTFVSKNCGGFVTSQEQIQLEISASQELIPNMSVSESTRISDNGVDLLRSLVFKIIIRSPEDAKHVSVLYSLYALPGWLSFSPHLTFCPFSTLSSSTKQMSLAKGFVV